MPKRTRKKISFPGFSRRKIEASFDGGHITSNGGAQLLQLVDELTGLIKTVAQTVGDKRRRRSCLHTHESLIRQRVFGIALGYEDLNDHDDLRRDQALQTALHKDKVLASSSTLCRFENQADRQMAVAIHEVLVEQFIASFRQAPKQLILDVDATDDPVHGGQEGRFFNGYYKSLLFPAVVCILR